MTAANSQSFSVKSKRRLSTRYQHGVPLTELLKQNILGNDYDASRKKLSNRKNSEETTRSSLLPRLSLDANPIKGVGKRVVFKLDDLEKEEPNNRPLKIKSDLSSQSRIISREAVKYALEHKDNNEPSVYDMFFDNDLDITDDVEESEGLSVTESELDALGDINVSFRGNIRPTDKPVYGKMEAPKDLKALRGYSKRASMSTTSSFLMENLWPWPWLDPRFKTKDLYESCDDSNGTFKKQKELPSLPVPVLGQSLHRLLKSLKPFTNSSSAKRIRKLAEDFAKGDGTECQGHLLEAASSNKNWIRLVLPNYSRLYSRLAAPILNRGIVCPFMHDLWPENNDDQLDRATVIIEFAVDFWMLIRKENLVPISDTKGHQICMHEFRRLFSSVRIPGHPSDAIYTFFHTIAENDNTPKHIIVIYRGHIFTVNVMDGNYLPVAYKTIKLYLKEIINSVEEDNNDSEGHGVGILTSMKRDEWSTVRERLMVMSENNAASLREIETAMFVISLDTLRINDAKQLPHEAIFGDGFNRWYDKNLNFYIYANGLVTININSSLLDGNIAAIMLHYIHLRILESVEKWDLGVLRAVSKTALVTPHPHGSSIFSDLLTLVKSKASVIFSRSISLDSNRESVSYLPNIADMNAPRRLEFTLDEHIEECMERASISFSNLAASISTSMCSFDDYERQIFHNKGVCSDAFAQMILHYTFYTMYCRFPSVCANISLKRFYHGRFEIMRTTTEEMVAWCKVTACKSSTNAKKRESFWKAERKHRMLIEQNCSGLGFENHIAALRIIAEDKAMKTHALLQDELICKHLSTDQCDIFTECVGVGCTSCASVLPTSAEGYGVGYFVADTKIMFNVSSWQDVKSTSSELFAHSLRNTMHELNSLLCSL